MMINEGEKLINAMPLLVSLRMHGGDFDKARFIIEKVYETMAPEGEDVNKVAFEDKVDDIAWLLKPFRLRVKKSFLLWPDLKNGEWMPKRVWVRMENFADTTGVELSMMNIYYLRFAGLFKDKPTQTDKEQKKGVDLVKQGFKERAEQRKYEKALADMLGHLVKRKVWSWKRMCFVDADYVTGDVMRLGQRLLRMDEGFKYWLIKYFEDTMDWFVRAYAVVFEQGGEDVGVIFEHGDGWIKALEDVAATGVMKDLDHVYNKNVHEIWGYLKRQKQAAMAVNK